MRYVLVVAVCLCIGSPLATAQLVRPFECDEEFRPAGSIDRAVLLALRERGISPAPLCSDEVFLRRVHLDAIGTLPEPAEVRRFLADRAPDKRRKAIDALLARDEFAHYWTLKWCDLLRVKAEFPINLWPNGVQAYARWIREAIGSGMPFDRFARELLTSSGSNYRVPPVNFYRAVEGREPASIAAAVALTFLGVRFETWSPERRAGMAAFFSRISYKETGEWKEEIVLLDPLATGPLEGVFPDGTCGKVPEGEDPRVAFADWLIRPENPWFAPAIANRVWSWLMGFGIVEEPDDFRPDNPPSNPALLACLVEELVRGDFDLRHLFREILNSRTYQQSSIPRSDHPEAEALFASYPVRRLDAEVLMDAICAITGTNESYSSMVPEPFTYLPPDQRSIGLTDGSITSPFLEAFGRPPRDTGLESERVNRPTPGQRLHLLNSSDIHGRIAKGPRLRKILAAARGARMAALEEIYLAILSRRPTEEEVAAIAAYASSTKLEAGQAVQDLVWALVNSKEFLYRH